MITWLSVETLTFTAIYSGRGKATGFIVGVLEVETGTAPKRVPNMVVRRLGPQKIYKV